MATSIFPRAQKTSRPDFKPVFARAGEMHKLLFVFATFLGGPIGSYLLGLGSYAGVHGKA